MNIQTIKWCSTCKTKYHRQIYKLKQNHPLLEMEIWFLGLKCLVKPVKPFYCQDNKHSPQGSKVWTFGRQNERYSSYIRLAHTSIFGLCFMSVCLMKSICYSLIYSSLIHLLAGPVYFGDVSPFVLHSCIDVSKTTFCISAVVKSVIPVFQYFNSSIQLLIKHATIHFAC